MQGSMTRSLTVLLLLFLVVGTFVYGCSFDNSFREDDLYFLTAAIELPGPGAIFHPQQSIAFFRPAAFGLFWLEYLMFGFHGGAYLVFNFMLHLINALLAGLLLRRIGLNPLAAILAAGSFFIGLGHYGKQVTWACTSGGLMTVTLTLLALCLATAPGSCDGKRISTGRFVLLLLCAILAPLFHESGLVAPLLIMILVAGGQGVRSALKLRFLLILGLTWGVWFLSTYLHPSASTAAAVADQMALAPFFRLIGYLGLMVLPLQGSAPGGESSTLGAVIDLARILQPVIGSGFLIWTIYLLARRRRGAAPALALWTVLAILPFTLVPLPGRWLELRYLYLAAIPMCALLALGFQYVWERRRVVPRVLVTLVAVVVMAATISLTMVLERKYDREAATGINAQRLEATQIMYDGLH
jgi:protein O-mannosyl-transferase